MELTEAVSRQFLKLHVPGTDIAKAILEAVLKFYITGMIFQRAL